MTSTATNETRSLPTTTAHTVRLCLFQATRRPVMLKGERITTPWGEIRLTGRLGQQHADVLEAICFERERRADLEDGRIKLLVDPAKVRRRTGIVGGEQFQRIATELQAAVIEILSPEKLACSGHIVDHIDYATRSDGTRITRYDPLTKGERGLWRVELGKAFCKLVARDIWLGYDPAPIARLPHGITQAVARHVLSHKTEPPGGWTLDGLIAVVAGRELKLSEQFLRHRRHELRADADALAGIGIVLDGDRVHRS